AREAGLASFYMGVCHMRGQRYQKAVYHLGRARNLPVNLESDRRKLLSLARRQQRAERQGALPSGASPYVIVPTPPPPAPAYADPNAQAPAEATAAKESPPAAPPSPKTGFSTAVTPGIK